MPPPKPCTTLATHHWSQGTSLHLTLPDTQGWTDVLRCWQCQRCGLQTWATGAIESSTPPLTPVEWEVRADWQQASGDLYGCAVKQQEQWAREKKGMTKRLQVARRRRG